MGATVSAGLFRLLRTVEPALTDEVLTRAGLRCDALSARVDHEVLDAFFAIGSARDPLFGVRCAVQLGTGALELLDFLVRSSATIAKAFETTARYHRLLHEALEFRIVERGRETDVDSRLAVPSSAALLEFGVGLLALAMRTAGYRAPGTIYFAHEAPAPIRAYEQLLGMPVRFSAPHNGGCFCSLALQAPIASADADLYALLERHANTMLAQLPADDRLVTRVRSMLTSQLDRGPPSFAQVAKQLRMSPRTLRRRLVDDGVSYQSLIDGTRRDIALRHLEHDAEELAFMLGFADANAFRRAFKRWTGSTPRALRRAVES